MKEKHLRTQILEIHRRGQRIPISVFCRNCGISEDDYRKLKNNNFDVLISTLLKIAEYTKIPAFVFLLED